MDKFISKFLSEVGQIAHGIDYAAVERLVDELVNLRERQGRLFFLGVGGGAGNAAHAVNDWLKTSRISSNDAVFVLSVGGGNKEKNISTNIVEALEYASSVGATILGIVGRDGGFTAKTADACVVIPTVSPENITAHTESFQAVVWHLVVSHPRIKVAEMKWESVR